MLILNANISVLESAEQSQREYFLLCGYFYAALNGKPTRESIEHLRKALLLFIEPIVLLDAVIAQLVAGPLKDRPMLFRDSEEKLAEQLEMATQLSTGLTRREFAAMPRADRLLFRPDVLWRHRWGGGHNRMRAVEGILTTHMRQRGISV